MHHVIFCGRVRLTVVCSFELFQKCVEVRASAYVHLMEREISGRAEVTQEEMNRTQVHINNIYEVYIL